MKTIRLCLMGCCIFLACAFLAGTARADLAEGLVANYPFAGNANDESGNGHNATASGVASIPDRSGNADGAYYFDGAAVVTLPSDAAFYSDEFSIRAWVRFSALNPNDYYMIYSTYGGNWKGMTFYIDTAGYVHGDVQDGCCNAVAVASSSVLKTGGWHMVTLTFDRFNLRLFIDGVLDAVTPNTITYDPAGGVAPTIGKASWYDGYRMVGAIDDVLIYNRALTAAEVQELYEPDCKYVLWQMFSKDGGTGMIRVDCTSELCEWTAESNRPRWLTVVSGQSGTGDGNVTFTVSENKSTSERKGTLKVAGRLYRIVQEGAEAD